MPIKNLLFLLTFVSCTLVANANLLYHPVTFVLSTDKPSYHEGEKIAFNITITNTSTEFTYPVLLPHTQNVGQKLFYLNAYDKANNTLLLRYSEDKMLKMMVHDTGTVQIKYLKPLEQIVVPIHINDFENYYSYHTQNSSHHSFGEPLFAGIYKANVTYNPNGIALGDSIYSYYSDFGKGIIPASKLLFPELGQITNMIELKIRRNPDTIFSIEREKYFIKTDGYMYYYFTEPVDKISTDSRCRHITTLPPDSCTMPKGEYFYTQFTDLHNEYIARFDDGDIREYRKFRNECPEYLYTERFNEFKQKTDYELQLPDKRFYSISYHQPGGKPHQETHCSANGTLCNVTTHVYDKNGVFIKKEVTQTQPCIQVQINGEIKSYKAGIVELGG